MGNFETAWKILAASVIVWRLTSFFFDGAAGTPDAARLPHLNQPSVGAARGWSEQHAVRQRFPASRLMDCLYWASVWMSAQATILVLCGVGGLVLNWAVVSGIARMRSVSQIKATDQGAAMREATRVPHKTQECSGTERLCL